MYRNLAAIEERRRNLTVMLLTMGSPSVRKLQDAMRKAHGMEVSRGTIHHDLIAIREEWKQERLRNVDEVTGRELNKLELVEQNAWQLFGQQRQPVTRTITRTRQVTVRTLREVPGGAPVAVDEVRTLTNTYTEQYTPPPDSRPLDTIVKALERRAKMLGLDAKEPAGLTVNVIPVTVLEQASVEELDEIERGRIPKRIAQLAAGATISAGPSEA